MLAKIIRTVGDTEAGLADKIKEVYNERRRIPGREVKF